MASSTAPNKWSPEKPGGPAEPGEDLVKAECDILDKIIQSSPIPQFAIDRHHRVISWNRALEEFSGIPAAEIAGTNLHWRAFYESERPCLADILVNGDLEEIHLWYGGKFRASDLVDGAYEVTDFFPSLGSGGAWLYFTAAAIKNEKGEVIGAVETLEDITARKQLEESLTRFNEKLENGIRERTVELKGLLQEKETLLRDIHHRVKNNLQIVASLLSLQSRYVRDDATLMALKESQNRVRAIALVHERIYRSSKISHIDLSDYIRFLSGNLFSCYGVDPERIRLNIGIEDISVDIGTAVPLGLITNELLSNSLKHAFPGGSSGAIDITGHRNARTITLTFSDNGIGIPDKTDIRDPKTLGLRLINNLVEQLKGAIELDRTKGTVFKITVVESSNGKRPA